MKKLVCFLVFSLLAAAAFGTPPPPVVSDVGGLQMWPFDRCVVINYKLDLKEGSEYSIKFLGSLDGGKTSFDLSEKGVLSRDGANREDGAGGFGEHTVVGSYLPNAWGLYDMHGNVMEWCLDWYAGYDGDATDSVGGESGTYRVIRGGGYVKTAYDCRSAARGASDPGYGFYNYFGFRVALVP